jgi:type IV pilus assembly protein PilB
MEREAYAAEAGRPIDLSDLANDAPIVKFVNLVLLQAVQDRASDIHFEPFETEFKIRYRVDGALYEMSPPPKHLALPVVSRIKVMANLNISERRLPQDGRISLTLGKPDRLICVFPPCRRSSANRWCLRVLDRSSVNLELESSGFPKHLRFRQRSHQRPTASSSSPARPVAARRPRSTPACAG